MKASTCTQSTVQRTLINVEQQHRAMLQKKQDDVRMNEQKVLQEKEKLTSEIVLIGLWQTKDDVEQQLLRLKSETKKRRH